MGYVMWNSSATHGDFIRHVRKISWEILTEIYRDILTGFSRDLLTGFSGDILTNIPGVTLMMISGVLGIGTFMGLGA